MMPDPATIPCSATYHQQAGCSTIDGPERMLLRGCSGGVRQANKGEEGYPAAWEVRQIIKTSAAM